MKPKRTGEVDLYTQAEGGSRPATNYPRNKGDIAGHVAGPGLPRSDSHQNRDLPYLHRNA